MRFMPLICAIDDGCGLVPSRSVRSDTAVPVEPCCVQPTALVTGVPALIDGPFAETKEHLGGLVAGNQDRL